MTERGIVDLNFAYARHRAEEGEPRAHAMADALLPGNMLAFLQGGRPAMDRARHILEKIEPRLETGLRGINDETLLYRPEEVRLLSPIPNPPSLRDFYAFEDHVKRSFEKRGDPMPREWYEIPVYYKSGHHNILGTEQDVLWPSFTEKFDYELEMAVVIGRRGTNIKAPSARDWIAGYTVMNDFSARDIQRKEMKVRLGPAKGKDWATAVGPYLVTPDEIPDPYNLRMTARINGELWSEGNTASLHWKFEQMIEFLTTDDTILPGDIIGSGTVGTGCGLELDRWIRPGDTMELEIEKVGVLRNRVVRAGLT